MPQYKNIPIHILNYTTVPYSTFDRYKYDRYLAAPHSNNTYNIPMIFKPYTFQMVELISHLAFKKYPALRK